MLVRVRHRGLLAHRIQLTPDTDLSAVSGDQVKDWRFDSRTGVLTVDLASAIRDSARLKLVMRQPLEPDSPKVGLVAPDYLDASQLNGVLAVLPQEGWQSTIDHGKELFETGRDKIESLLATAAPIAF